MSLPSLQIDSVTVGGVSAGCYMATQVHFAFSSLVKGNACTAGGPFYCSLCALAHKLPFS